MARRYPELTFTDSVRARQEREGTRATMERLERMEVEDDRLHDAERDFIESRDGLYMATVNQDGRPYLQFRGGEVGFVRVLDDRTIGWADFRGNKQYISLGNIDHDDRVSLFLMDYATRTRLKITGRARIVGLDEDAELVARLEHPDSRARVERGIVIEVEAFDWNCPQHITPRFTEAEVEARLEPLRARIRELEAAATG